MSSSIGTNTYTTALPELASEIFDGELVIANYKLGLYYSISIEGSWIWQGLAHGLTVSQIVQWLSGHFPDQAGALSTLVEEFVEKLIAEKLILQSSKSDSSATGLPILTGSVLTSPVIESFNDLQDLLLLDPVHDVDHTGWPRRPD